VSVYGGFVGTEAVVTARNYVTNVTILSGDIGTLNNNTDNSYNVVVSIGNTGTTVLDGFTITKGNANNGSTQYSTGGGIYNSGTTVTYANCIITANAAIGNGGGIYITGSGTVTFTNCTFSSNSTTVAASISSGGGGLCAYGGTATLTGCTFSSNTSSSEGGGALSSTSGVLVLASCTFTGNVASGSGGGIACYSAASYLTGCTLTSNISNSTSTGGGGAYTSTGTGMQLTSCAFNSNTARSYGGGFYDNGGDALGITKCSFSSNVANYGGGLCTNNGTSPVITNCIFTSNMSYEAGGGMYNNNAGTGTIQVDTFFNNTATDTSYATTPVAGGGVCNVNSSNIALAHCFLQGNVAANGDGGGLYDFNTSTQNDTSDIFMANKANNGNGGGLVDSSGNTKFFKCVFADNQCSKMGGGVYTANNNGSLESSTFYNNQAGTNGGDGIYISSGNIKVYGNMIWSRTSTSIGLVVSAAASGSAKVDYNDIIGVPAYTANNGVGNISIAPTFGNSGNYVGADGLWATLDDGLHLANGSAGTDLVPSGYYYNVTDIAESARPDAGGTLADMGAYESAGTIIPLADQLLGFTAASTGNHTVDLSWEVDVATEPVSFQVERSVNGTDFTVIGEVKAVNGQGSYQFVDPNVTGGVLYYRLWVALGSGGAMFSNIQVVRGAAINGRSSLRPSVGYQGVRTLYIAASRRETLGLNIVDVSGHMLAHRQVAVEAGDNYLLLDISGLGKGLYYVQLRGDDGVPAVLLLEKL
jgi:parallel beta-helix repeat protein